MVVIAVKIKAISHGRGSNCNLLFSVYAGSPVMLNLIMFGKYGEPIHGQGI